MPGPDIDETPKAYESACDVSLRLSAAKAEALAKSYPTT